ncbi:SDR family NAD(P)-dependent oxidoreductase [Corynebacterium hylobatis]|uniref:SDR family NAD(P)-dependent oxidoreductase n=1 Tax=Corynebacterium hylobatis TaxID=1859290 RepID=A0A3S0A157_9CORY|nr:SDR family NAD(P)-dependent oxidoreductase [Corynebacterium hylobatis]RSZ65540.1 SDR family NAD(P)-dependent oxidoreductase [Corynebacterium hylobatis]
MSTPPRTILVTGSTSGLGCELARQYAAEPGHLILHGRNPIKLRKLVEGLSGAVARISTVEADLADLAQVRQLADAVPTLTDSLSVLVNNAGIGQGRGNVREESVDGLELRLAVNHLAPFALTLSLLPLLRAGDPARVVNVASAAQTPVDFADPQLTARYSGSRAYAQSKFAMIATGFYLARLLPAEEITVNSLHPATLMPTPMVAEGWGTTVDDLATGVAAVRHLIDSPTLAGVSGRYFSRQEVTDALPEAHDPEVQRHLWRLSEEWSGVRFPG